MKNIFTTLILSAIFVPAFGQSWYSLNSANSFKQNKEALTKAESIKDLIPNYPTSLWIENYSSVSVSAHLNGKSISAKSNNITLSKEQKDLLKNAELNTSVSLKVNYNYKNPVTDVIESATMYLYIPVIPDKEAEFPQGSEGMTAFLKENVLDKINVADTANWKTTTMFTFMINEDGKISDPKLSGEARDKELQKIVLEALNKMPNWKPAETASGAKVKQEFKLFFPARNGKGGC